MDTKHRGRYVVPVSDLVGWSAHVLAVRRLHASYDSIPAGSPVRLAKRTCNLFRARTTTTAPGLTSPGSPGWSRTPFDMVVLNNTSRYHLCKQAVRAPVVDPKGAGAFPRYCDEKLAEHRLYVDAHFEDMPEIRDWTWTD